MSHYEDGKMPPVGVPPSQGYGYPPQQAGYPQGYPPQGYPQDYQPGYPPQQTMYQQPYQQPYPQQPYPQQQQNNDRSPSFLEGCLAALCCCCLCDLLF